MKYGSRLQFECPDNCPKNCEFINEFREFGQSSICVRCPQFNCSKDNEGFCLIEPSHYRDDWGEEWDLFFKTGKIPKLKLTR
jgi:hypothetical protein